MQFPLKWTTLGFEHGKGVILPHVLCHHCKYNRISVHKDVISAKSRACLFGIFSIWIHLMRTGTPFHYFSCKFIGARICLAWERYNDLRCVLWTVSDKKISETPDIVHGMDFTLKQSRQLFPPATLVSNAVLKYVMPWRMMFSLGMLNIAHMIKFEWEQYRFMSKARLATRQVALAGSMQKKKWSKTPTQGIF